MWGKGERTEVAREWPRLGPRDWCHSRCYLREKGLQSLFNLTPSPIPHTPHSSCLVDGCTANTYGKQYCRTHIKGNRTPVVITDEQRTHMRSDCCNAACADGKRHDYGKQYCAQCKQACCWHPNTLRAAPLAAQTD
ncbi:MAG: hypothetical protein Q7R81_03305 [Candidatus Peregrinibacteria bacterium]|nr:hypothetical protein [Candidatus Peregrinibacteria bacterium]